MKDNVAGSAYIELIGKMDKLEGSIKTAVEKLGDKGKKGGKSFADGFSNALGGIKGAILGAVTVSGVAMLGKEIITLASNLQQAKISFTTMLGSAKKADKLLRDLSDFASKTPFELPGIRQNAKQLLAMGVAQENLIPTLKELGDVSSALNIPLERLAVNYGQVLTQGKLTGKEMRDFVVSGVPLLDELAKNLGKTKVEIQEMISAGEISSNDMITAFKTMTSEGGRFANMMDEQSKSLQGLWSNMMDNLSLLGEKIGSAFLPGLSSIVNWFNSLIETGPGIALVTTAVLGLGAAIAFLTGPIGWITGGLIALGVATAGIVSYFSEAQNKIPGVSDELKKVEKNLDDLNEKFKIGAISIDEYIKQKAKLEQQLEKTKKKYEELNSKINENSKIIKDGEDKINTYNKILINLKQQQENYNKKIQEGGLITNIYKKDLKGVIKQQENYKKKIEEKRQAIKLATAQNMLLTGSLGNVNQGLNSMSTAKTKEEFENLRQQVITNIKTHFEYIRILGAKLKAQIVNKEIVKEEAIKRVKALKSAFDSIGKSYKNVMNMKFKAPPPTNNNSKATGGGSGRNKKYDKVKQAKEELDKRRDLKMKEVQESLMSEEMKQKALVNIKKQYDQKKLEIEGKTNDEILKEAENTLKESNRKFKEKVVKNYKDISNATDDSKKKLIDYAKKVEKINDKFAEMKKTATETLRDINHQIGELDTEHGKDMAGRGVDLQKELEEKEKDLKKQKKEKPFLDRTANLFKKEDLEKMSGSSKISGIKVDELLKYKEEQEEIKKIQEEINFINKNTTEEQRKQAEELANMNESQRQQLEYEKERASLTEKANITEAFKNSKNVEDMNLEITENEDGSLSAKYEDEKGKMQEIKDYKNIMYAKELLDKQEKMQQEKAELIAKIDEEKELFLGLLVEKQKYEKSYTKTLKEEINKQKGFVDGLIAKYKEAARARRSAIGTAFSGTAGNIGGKAFGGSVQAGMPYLIGENFKPELFVPSVSGTVQPINKINTSKNINVDVGQIVANDPVDVGEWMRDNIGNYL